MSTRLRIGLLSAASALALSAAAPRAGAQSWNLYQSDTSLVVPYIYGDLNSRNHDGTFSNHTANLNIQIAGKPIGVTIDTGSTGIAISQALLPSGALNGLTPLGPGAINYDSSGNTPTGTFYELPISILGGKVNGQAGVGTTTVKVLVVTNDTGTAYFGIGNNRNNVYSGVYNQSLTFQQNVAQGNITQISAVGMNPLIDVAVNGTALPNQGYVVMNNQIVIGLTTANNAYSFVKLTPDTAAGPMLWNGIPVALSNGSGAYVTGTILHDTGIFNAYLKPFASAGDTVNISMPGMPQQGAFYSFVVPAHGATCGTATALTPCEVLGSTSSTPFLNTGRQFYAGFNYLFDPVNGYVGYALSSSGLTDEAVLIPLLALQATVGLPNGFATNLPVALFAPTTLTTPAGGAATFDAAFMGFGSSLTVAGSGSVVFNGPVGLAPGTFTVSSGASATINASLTASAVSIATQAGLINNGLIGASVTNNGTLTNNGMVLGDIVNNGALGGNGTVVGSLANYGVVSPGNSIGTVAVNGTYTHGASSTYQLEVSNTGQSDLIAVNGGAALQGGSVNVTAFSGGYASRTTYRILSATGGVSGAFASVNELYPFLLSSLSYDPNNVYLTLEVGGFAAAAQTPNQYAVGAALDASAATASGDFATVLGSLATATSAQGQAFLTSISGTNYSGFSNSMVQGAQLFMNNFLSQASGANRGGNKLALAEACDVACDPTSPPRWGAWGGALGGLGTVGAGQAVGGVTYNAGGFAAGLDRAVSGTVRLGVTVGYTGGSQWVSGFSGQGFSDTVQAGLYGNYAQGPVYLDGLVGYAYSANTLSRSIVIPNLGGRTAQGQTGANQVYGQLEGGYRFGLGGLAEAFVTPFARLQAYTGTQNGFTESGAQSLDLSVAAQTTSSLRSVLGAQLGGSMDLGWRAKLNGQFRLGWSHEYADTARPVSATLVGAPAAPFTTYGASPQRDGVVVGVSANTAIAEAASLYLRYEGDISGQDSSHALTAGVRMTW